MKFDKDNRKRLEKLALSSNSKSKARNNQKSKEYHDTDFRSWYNDKINEDLTTRYSVHQRRKVVNLLNKLILQDVQPFPFDLNYHNQRKAIIGTKHDFPLILKDLSTGLYVTSKSQWEVYLNVQDHKKWMRNGRKWKGDIPKFPNIQEISFDTQAFAESHLINELNSKEDKLSVPSTALLSIKEYETVIKEQNEILDFWCKTKGMSFKIELKRRMKKRDPFILKEILNNFNLVNLKYKRSKQVLLELEHISENPVYFEEKLAKHNLLNANLESSAQKEIRDK